MLEPVCLPLQKRRLKRSCVFTRGNASLSTAALPAFAASHLVPLPPLARAHEAAAAPSSQVRELAPLSVRNPLRSPLLWGAYEVLYCSKPTAVGGPLRKGAGPVLAPGQSARQTLVEPGTLINEVTFKTLGFLPGYSRQVGSISPLSGDTFLVRIPPH
jgi:hypothetical protein